MPPGPLLVADIGGTRARFARSTGPGELSDRTELAVAEHASFEAALEAYLAEAGGPAPERIAVAIAGPVSDGRAKLTNGDWEIDSGALAARFRLAGARLLNDFEAVALALPLLAPEDLEAIGGGSGVAGAPRLALGPGTGLGVAALIERDGEAIPVAGEGGHVSLPSRDDREDEVLRALRTRFGHVSAERALSGQGLETLYTLLAGGGEVACPAAEIAPRAEAGDETAQAALTLFAGFLGTVAADMALAFGARGGVYLAGGVLPKLGAAFDREAFRQRFEDKGRFSVYLAAIPSYLVHHRDTGLLGLTAL